MKGLSDTVPEFITKSSGKTQVNYDVNKITVDTVSGKSKDVYEYEYVEIEGEFTRDKVIAGLLLVNYDYDEQIAILNNYASDPTDPTEFNSYQAARTDAKVIADRIDY